MFARGPRGIVALAFGVLALTLTLVAQTPAPSASAAPRAQAPAAPSAPPAQAPQGTRGAPMWEADFSKKGTVPVLSPAEEAKKIWMQPGYKLEPVLADPDIQEPAQIAF